MQNIKVREKIFKVFKNLKIWIKKLGVKNFTFVKLAVNDMCRNYNDRVDIFEILHKSSISVRHIGRSDGKWRVLKNVPIWQYNFTKSSNFRKKISHRKMSQLFFLA